VEHCLIEARPAALLQGYLADRKAGQGDVGVVGCAMQRDVQAQRFSQSGQQCCCFEDLGAVVTVLLC